MTPTVRKRLPGGRPAADVLQRYREHRSALLGAEPDRRATLGLLFYPEPDKLYLWYVRLSCGCVKELLTRSQDTPPHEQQWRDNFTGDALPRGEITCWHKGERHYVWREIAEWNERLGEKVIEADPVEPPDWWGPDDPKGWAKCRDAEDRTVAEWRVKLECGHWDTTRTSLEWTPKQGHPPQLTPRQIKARLARHDREWPQDDDDMRGDGRHFRKMIELGLPEPTTEVHCWVCPRARAITAFTEPVSLVTAAERSRGAAKRPDRRHLLEQQLESAQAQVATLRERLAELPDDEGGRS